MAAPGHILDLGDVPLANVVACSAHLQVLLSQEIQDKVANLRSREKDAAAVLDDLHREHRSALLPA